MVEQALPLPMLRKILLLEGSLGEPLQSPTLPAAMSFQWGQG